MKTIPNLPQKLNCFLACTVFHLEFQSSSNFSDLWRSCLWRHTIVFVEPQQSEMMRLDFREAFGICKTCVTGVLLYPLIKFLQWWVHYEVTSHFMSYIYCVLISDEFTRTWLDRHEHFVFLQYYVTTPYY